MRISLQFSFFVASSGADLEKVRKCYSIYSPDHGYLCAVLCPYYDHQKKIGSSTHGRKKGHTIRRRRECLNCGHRFTSYERIENIPHMVVKKGGYRQRLDHSNMLSGLLKACEKRPVAHR